MSTDKTIDEKIIEDTKRGVELLYALVARIAALPVDDWLMAAKATTGSWDDRTRAVVRILAAAVELKKSVIAAQPFVIAEVLEKAKDGRKR